MQYGNAVFFFQNFFQTLANAPNSFLQPLGHIAVRKAFVGMGVENQYFGLFFLRLYGQIQPEGLLHVYILRKQCCAGIHNIVMAFQIGKILHFLQRFRSHAKRPASGGNGLLFFKLHIVRADNRRRNGFLFFLRGRPEGTQAQPAAADLSRQRFRYCPASPAHFQKKRQSQQKKNQSQKIQAQCPFFHIPRHRHRLPSLLHIYEEKRKTRTKKARRYFPRPCIPK